MGARRRLSWPCPTGNQCAIDHQALGLGLGAGSLATAKPERTRGRAAALNLETGPRSSLLRLCDVRMVHDTQLMVWNVTGPDLHHTCR